MRRILGLLLLLIPATATAHPLPNLRFDRTIHVRLAPDAITVRYSLEINDWTMVLDGKDLVNPADLKPGGQRAYAQKYAEKKAPILADNLRATLDGQSLTFHAEKVELEPEKDHLRLRFLMRAKWKPTSGAQHRFAFEDQNFEGRSGSITLTLDKSGEGLELDDVVEPVDLRGKSPFELKPSDELRARKASATFDVTAPPVPPPAPPTAPAPSPISVAPTPPEITITDEPKGVFTALADHGLAGLFDSGYGLGVLLLLAFGFGAAHAFTPGHGKTLVAAYLVGERGTVTHALTLGLTTTLAHTGSVILVALILRAYYGESVPAHTAAVLQVIGGLLIAGVGLWLFLQRIRGRADHVHLFTGKDERGRMNDESRSGSASSFIRVVLLGLGGGIVPCWDAVMLLLVAISAGQLGSALPLLLAFSAGLAVVLVALGIAVVYAQRAGGRKFGESRWFQALPIASALLLIGLGIWFARDGTSTLFAEPVPKVETQSR